MGRVSGRCCDFGRVGSVPGGATRGDDVATGAGSDDGEGALCALLWVFTSRGGRWGRSGCTSRLPAAPGADVAGADISIGVGEVPVGPALVSRLCQYLVDSLSLSRPSSRCTDRTPLPTCLSYSPSPLLHSFQELMTPPPITVLVCLSPNKVMPIPLPPSLALNSADIFSDHLADITSLHTSSALTWQKGRSGQVLSVTWPPSRCHRPGKDASASVPCQVSVECEGGHLEPRLPLLLQHLAEVETGGGTELNVGDALETCDPKTTSIAQFYFWVFLGFFGLF